MKRILLTWEIGLNTGHLVRLLPVAEQLKEQGHAVLAAVRDIPTAAAVFGPANISFVQAPILAQGRQLRHRQTGYADILLSQGWAENSVLWGLVQGWINLFRMFRPDVIVADFSPTACMAARITGVRVLLLGNGFELPPATDPLPPFPGFSWATQELAARSEAIAVETANTVIQAFKGKKLQALRDLFDPQTCLLATFPELDHYGARPNVRYIGMLRGQPKAEVITWPDEGEHRIFAYLRPNTEHVDAILGGLRESGTSVVCVAPGFDKERLNKYRSARITFTTRPVALEQLASSAHACVSYAAEGTVATFLLKGVPQLMSPRLVEGHMTAKRVVQLGAGLMVPAGATDQIVATMLDRLCRTSECTTKAMSIADRHRGFDVNAAVEEIVGFVNILTEDILPSHKLLAGISVEQESDDRR